VLSLGENKFKAGSWDLVRLNSNSFSDEVCQFVVGCGLPKYVLDLPPDMRNTPEICTQLGRISLPQFTGISLGLIGEGRGDVSRRADSPEFEELQAQIDALRADQHNLEQRRNAANIRETKKEKKKTKEEKEERKKRKEEKRRKNSEESSCFSPTPTCCDIETCKPKPSPQSILKEREEKEAERKDKTGLVRNKSLKRVSFEEHPEIIEEKEDRISVEPSPHIEEEEDIPALEEVGTLLDRAPTPPGERMAAADEQMTNPPPEVDEAGEPLPPPPPRKPHEKGIVFRDFDHVKDFENLVRSVVTLCSPEEQERLREMEEWIVKNEGTWVLSEGFNDFLGNVLHKSEWPSEARVAMLKLLAYGADQDDIVLILHMDRKNHLVMNYAQKFDRLPIGEQEGLARLFCNLFETSSASEWTLYISEWEAPGGGLPLSNIRVTTKVAVNALLGDTPALVEYGTALMSNLATKEVFDDVCSELAMAILQFFQQGKPPEEQVFRCMKALAKFCSISRETPQLVKMIGPDPSKFSGLSPRVDEQIAPLTAKLATIPMF